MRNKCKTQENTPQQQEKYGVAEISSKESFEEDGDMERKRKREREDKMQKF